MKVLRYLRFTRNYGLYYTRYLAIIEGYSDANWIFDIKDSKSTSGFVFILESATISLKSFKQTIIARSIIEYEFITLVKCGEETESLHQFLEDIPRWSKLVPTICIYFDSQAAIGRA